MANKNNKGLGRGIEAIFKDFESPDLTLNNVDELPLADIRPNPYQPRKSFDEAALQELADSIRQTGVFQPIIVRKSVNGYEIITGERRFRASKLAGKKTIPAIIREFEDPEMMEIAVLENLQREDLTPLDEAQAYDTLIKRLSLTQAEVSKRLGKSRPYIANYLRLLTLPNEVKKMLNQNKLSMGQARTLLSLKDKKRLIPLAKKTVSDNLTVRQLERLINQMNAGSQPQKKPVAKSPFLKASENQLQDRFGTKVSIAQSKQGKGKIEIDFTTADDLNRLLALLDVNLD
ncbi:MAG: ParB/RepB/Spo0J family partition protein [Lactobacillus sp.]|jgi:ParB family chromosome partitioning protein|uniref:ParB/RepB/Spo0J family partition protein n=1 Tax=Lacticaseibacillus suilingensis TaxID=2799577 RepID=A0ABW4BBN3_9LACO|nr:ParB/RepB/Spo0J family partition protein [Lacticaseibacillus suilingensis]MCI1894486.1 ParB/RepB/Spo0J family partition protein [Lactobacillus sp.]MCI1916945.1 ParB/RepB/Spo0J family partition protein [Lactobacillus sp.]MCI1941161.1 ParB/RepB/Spo0J family partition protein [Lactobacillus sp.]MCI1971705.1 ParB/RepB/Spo0J family partition protein [Lactobacillus sp.]MCI2016356.1 ParB/RepB/Spo0J family partition protein [Lactobacillus sp.]